LISKETDFQIIVPFYTENLDELKSLNSGSEKVYNFSGEQVFAPNTISTGVEASGFRKFKPLEGAILSLTGILNVEEIQSLSLEWGYETTPGNFIAQNSIDLLSLNHSQENGNLKVNMGNSLVQLIETMSLHYSANYKVTIKGNSNLALSGIASLKMPVIVESESISPRFELW
jgi:hypothetical protein